MLLHTIKQQLAQEYTLSDFFEATLTNASAEDFLSDAQGEISKDFSNSTTLHHRAKGILHRHAGKVGLNPRFTVVDRTWETVILRDAVHILCSKISTVKPLLKEYRASSADCRECKGAFAELYDSLQVFFSAVDWFEVVRLAAKLLFDWPDVREEESEKFRFLLVDEYQDLNAADQEFIRLLLNGRTQFLAAGDNDQSIYGELRYAHPQGILDFESIYPNTSVAVLPVTSRLPKAVIDATDALIRHNAGRRQKQKLLSLQHTDQRAAGGFVVSVNLKSGKVEREFIGSAIQALITHNPPVPPGEILVLCSSKTMGSELVQWLGASSYDLPISDQLNGANDPVSPDFNLALLCDFLRDTERNLPLRGLLDLLLRGNCSVPSILVQRALSNATSLWSAACSYVDENTLQGQLAFLAAFTDAVLEARQLVDVLDMAEHVARKVSPLAELLPYIAAARVTGKEEEPSSDTDAKKAVRFMTLHSSKGLEADFVFIPFMEDTIQLPARDEDEQRRLLYVAMTRAKVGVMFTWAWSRRSAGRFKSKGTGGSTTHRKPSLYIRDCGIPASMTHPWDKQKADELALKLLLKYVKTAGYRETGENTGSNLALNPPER